MNNTNRAGEPSYPTADGTSNTQGGITYDLGFTFVVVLFILILCYTTYKFKYKKGSQSPPPPPPPRTTTLRTTTEDSDTDDLNSVTHSNGLNDNILLALPTFPYSEAVASRPQIVDMGSGCSICLADYKAKDALRLLPECGHMFHVICVDTWLKVHSTCPVCRKSALPTELT